MLDIFNQNAFGVVQLTDAINGIKFVPGRIGQMGLFSASSLSGTSIAIDQRDGQLILVPPSPRGGPGTTTPKGRGSMLDLKVPHFEINDAIMAEEVQGLRAWGTENELETVQGKLAERLSEHSQSFVATEEYARIGAVKGVVTYADGASLNLFTTFGVAQENEIDFDLDNANPASGAVRKKCTQVVRLVAANLGGIPFTGIHCFCGDDFWDALIAHKEVRETYLNQAEASQLRGGSAYETLDYGGITFENYRGAVGATAFVDAAKAHFFPVGVPNLFRTYFAPADYNETVNTMGQRLYVRQWEMPNGKGVNLDVQMNALSICTRPKTLIKGKYT